MNEDVKPISYSIELCEPGSSEPRVTRRSTTPFPPLSAGDYFEGYMDEWANPPRDGEIFAISKVKHLVRDNGGKVIWITKVFLEVKVTDKYHAE